MIQACSFSISRLGISYNMEEFLWIGRKIVNIKEEVIWLEIISQAKLYYDRNNIILFTTVS